MATGGKLEWVFEIFDKISAPARKMAAAMDRLGKSTGGAGKHAKTAAGHFESLRHKVFEYGEIAHRVFEFAARIGEKALDFAKEVKNAIAFKQTTMIALEAALHSKEKAAEVFEIAEKFSKLTGIPQNQLVEIAKGLAESKFDIGGISKFMQMIGDVSILRGPAAMEQVAGVIDKIGNTGFATGRVLMGLEGTGIDLEKVYRNVASMFGLSADSLADLRKGMAQPLPAAGVLKAIAETFQEQFGGVGFLAQKQGQTLGGQFDRLTGGFERAMERLVGGRGLAMFQGALENLIRLVQPDGALGKAFRDLVNGPLGDFFKQFTGKEGLKKMADIFTDLTKALTSFIGVLKDLHSMSFGGGIADVLQPMLNPNTIANPVERLLTKQANARGLDSIIPGLGSLLLGPSADDISAARGGKTTNIVNVNVDAKGHPDPDTVGHKTAAAVAPVVQHNFKSHAIERGTQ